MGRLRDRRTRGPATIAIVVLLCVLAAGPVRAESLQGRVVEDHTGRPIMAANVRVAKIGQSILAAARGTDADGTFLALNLSAGEYRIEVSKPNYLPATLRLRLPLAATSGLRIRLVRLGVISGRVTDADGRPTRGSRVFVMLKPALGLPLQAFGNSYAVDDSGRYRIYNLPPGEYAVAVSSASFSDFSRSGLYYYPRNGQPRFFTFSGGEEYRDVNFTIVPGPLYHVSGKVVLPEGGGRAVLSLFLLDQPALPFATAWAAPDGSFRLEDIPSGSYGLAASAPSTGYNSQGAVLGRQAVYGRMHVEVTGDNVEGLTVAAVKGRSVSFTLRAAGSNGPPSGCPSSAQLTLVLLEALGTSERRSIEVSFGKEVTLDDVSPGRYRVAVANLGDTCFSASAPAVDLTEEPAASAVAVEITPAGSIRGTLRAGPRKPADFAIVLLASDALDAAQVAYPDAESHFSFTGLRPGRYRIAAQRIGDTPQARWIPDLWRMSEIELPGGSPTDVELSPEPVSDRKDI